MLALTVNMMQFLVVSIRCWLLFLSPHSFSILSRRRIFPRNVNGFFSVCSSVYLCFVAVVFNTLCKLQMMLFADIVECVTNMDEERKCVCVNMECSLCAWIMKFKPSQSSNGLLHVPKLFGEWESPSSFGAFLSSFSHTFRLLCIHLSLSYDALTDVICIWNF